MPSAQRTKPGLRKDVDPRDRPAYGLREAAHYLQIPTATLRSWVKGRTYATQRGERFFRPIIALPRGDGALLSFNNLAEAHVLSAFRRDHRIPLAGVRRALDFVQKRYRWKRPLIEQEFETDGAALFVRELNRIVDASSGGQVMLDCVTAYLKRLERSDAEVVRLWPFTRRNVIDSPMTVFIDPRISFGRPSLRGCNVPTAVIAERYKAGESVTELAADYGCAAADIEEGLRCELDLRIAA